MRLSHVLIKVKHLERAVQQYRNDGFSVEYGAAPDKATNALIWFEEGPFIELFEIDIDRHFAYKQMLPLLNILGKKAIFHRINYYQQSSTGLCDLSIETEAHDLKTENQILKTLGYTYNKMSGRRVNAKGEKLKWQLTVPLDLSMPFLMSAYNIEQRPSRIVHTNGARAISQVIYGTRHDNIDNLNKLVCDQRLQLIEGEGLADVIIDGWDQSLADIYN